MLSRSPRLRTPYRPGTRTGLVALFALLAILLFAVPTAMAAPADGSAITPSDCPLGADDLLHQADASTFQAGDGDQDAESVDCTDDGEDNPIDYNDWETFAAQTTVADDPNANDTAFEGGDKETEPGAWGFTAEDGGVNPNKDNLLAAFATTEQSLSGLKQYLYFAFHREAQTGNTYLTFELNQLKKTWTNANGAVITCRTDGDLLISYEVDSGGSPPNVHIRVYQWTTTVAGDVNQDGDNTDPEDICGAVGTLTLIEPGPDSQGAVNAADITNYLGGPSTFAEGEFGEAGINLTNAFPAFISSGPCRPSGQISMHSRSSVSIDSQLQDIAGPVGLAKPCSAEGEKYEDLNGDGSKDEGEPGLEGWTFYADLNDNGVLDDGEPSDVSDADGAWKIEDIQLPEGGGNTVTIREVQQDGWTCSQPNPCSYTADFSNDTDLDGFTFGNYVKPTVEIVKDTDPEGGQGTFDFASDNTDLGATFQLVNDGDSTGTVTTAPGSYSVTESLPGDSIYRLDDVTCTGDSGSEGNDASTGSVENGAELNLQSGDEVVCTFTNKRKMGKLRVIKHVVNDNGGDAVAGDWSLHVEQGDADISGSPQAGNEDGTVYNVPTGDYDVSETGGPSGYHFDGFSGDCDEGGSVTVPESVDEGGEVTCTLTNNDISPQLTVIKHVINNNGGTAVAGDFTMKVTAGNPSDASFPGAEDPGTTITLDAGDYSVDEDMPADKGVYAKSLSEDCSGSIALGESKTCTITNDDNPREGQIHVDKNGPSFAYHGDQITFTYDVTATGSPLTNVTLSDDKCSSISAPTKTGGNDDDTLDLGETWHYTCTTTVSANHAAGEEDPIVNTATAKGTDETQTERTSTDTHSTDIRHVAIAIDKQGPASVNAGDTIGYTLDVTIPAPGDTSFDEAKVVVTDQGCDAAPQLSSKNGDSSPGTLDPGDRWTYVCQHQTATTDSGSYLNTGNVEGTNKDGKKVTATDQVTTTINAVAVLPEDASARLRGPSGCVAKPFKVFVTGKGIKRVTFYRDGKRIKRLSKPSSGSRFQITVNPKGQGFGVHRITVKVSFNANTQAKTRTLRLTYQRCQPGGAKPKFTG
jgi:Prealbumin-like fold domain